MIEQDPTYHAFADPLGGLISNVAFLVAGVAGLRNWRTLSPYRRVAFAGTILTAFGSAWYHANPNNATLAWDRLPMTLTTHAIVGAALDEDLPQAAGIGWEVLRDTAIDWLVGQGLRYGELPGFVGRVDAQKLQALSSRHAQVRRKEPVDVDPLMPALRLDPQT